MSSDTALWTSGTSGVTSCMRSATASRWPAAAATPLFGTTKGRNSTGHEGGGCALYDGPQQCRSSSVYRQPSTIEPMLRCGMQFGGRAAAQYGASTTWLAGPRASAGAGGCRRRSGRLESCRLHGTRSHRHHVSVAADRPLPLPRAPAGARRCAQVGIQHGAGRGRSGGRSAPAGCGAGDRRATPSGSSTLGRAVAGSCGARALSIALPLVWDVALFCARCTRVSACIWVSARLTSE